MLASTKLYPFVSVPTVGVLLQLLQMIHGLTAKVNLGDRTAHRHQCCQKLTLYKWESSKITKVLGLKWDG